MFTQLMILEVKALDDRIHRFECHPDSPLGEVHDALCAMKSEVVKKIMEIEEAEIKKKEENKKEEPKPEAKEE